MKLLLLCIAFWASSALASIRAGAFGSIFLWYAYVADGLANENGGQYTIAAGCKRSDGKAGRCNFDDFLRYISKKDKRGNSPWLGSTTVGEEQFPDVVQTSAEMKKLPTGVRGKPQPYLNTYDMNNILDFGGEAVNFKTLISKVTTVIESASTKLGKNNDKLNKAIQGAEESLKWNRLGRYADQFDTLIQDINKTIKTFNREGFTAASTKDYTETNADGEEKVQPFPDVDPNTGKITYKNVQEYDSKATIEKCPDELKDKLSTALVKTTTNWNSNGKTVNHFADLDAVAKGHSNLQAIVAASCK